MRRVLLMFSATAVLCAQKGKITQQQQATALMTQHVYFCGKIDGVIETLKTINSKGELAGKMNDELAKFDALRTENNCKKVDMMLEASDVLLDGYKPSHY